MTAFDRFDPFERRISSAIDEIAAARTPNYLDDIFRLTARSPQRPRWTFPERWITVNRATQRVAAAAAVVVLAVGTFFALGRMPGTGSLPSPSPSQSVTPTFDLSTFPSAIWGDWIAEVGDTVPGLDGNDNNVQLSISAEDGESSWVQVDSLGTWVLQSRAIAAPDGEIRMVSEFGAALCDDRTEGRYAWSRSEDGLFLTLALISDACDVRAATLARTWVHSLGAVSDGGLGVNYAIEPMMLMALPTGQRYGMGGGADAPEIKTIGDSQPFRAFVVIKNPGGYRSPCGSPDREPMSLARTPNALVAYVNGLPGATVVSTNALVDGRPVVRLDVSIDPGVACAAGEIGAFRPNAPNDPATWNFAAGENEDLYVVGIDADVLLLWYQGPAGEEQAVIDSIEFIDALPSP